MEGLKDHRDDFDKSWAEAFDGAEMTPPDAVWMKLDAQLAQQEANKSRRAMIWYRWVAAASLLLLMGLGTYVFLNPAGTTPSTLAGGQESGQETIAATSGTESDQTLSEGSPEKAELAAVDQIASTESRQTTGNTTKDGVSNPQSLESIENKEVLPSEDFARNEKSTPDNQGTSQTVAQAPEKSSPLSAVESSIAMQSAKTVGVNDTGLKQGTPTYSLTNDATAAGTSEIARTGDLGNASLTQVQSQQGNQPLNQAAGSDWVEHLATDQAVHNELAIMQAVPLEYKEVAFSYPQYSFDGYILPIWEPVKKSTDVEKYWAGVNLGGGGYAHNVGTGGGLFGTQNDEAFANPGEFSPVSSDGSYRGSVEDLGGLDQLASQSGGRDTRAGTSFSLGGEAGLRLSRRWALISGLYYTQNFAETSSRAFLQNPDNSLTPLTLESAYTETALNSEVVLEPEFVNVRSRYEMLGVPLQIGYRLLDKRLSIALQTGVMTNVFLQSKIQATEGGFGQSFVGAGEDGSPYRRFSWQAMGGLSMGYKLHEQYSLQFTPGFRLPLGPLTDNPGSLEARPRQFNFSLGLRYHLK